MRYVFGVGLILWGLFGIFLNFTFVPLNFLSTLLTGFCMGEGTIILINEYGIKRKEAE